MFSENFGNLFLVLLSIKHKLKRMNKSQILDFLALYKTSQLLGMYIWVVYIVLDRVCEIDPHGFAVQ